MAAGLTSSQLLPRASQVYEILDYLSRDLRLQRDVAVDASREATAGASEHCSIVSVNCYP
jgi:hypothetical protein